MIARIAILAILGAALIAGAALYYLQVYAYYDEVSAAEVGNVQLTRLEDGEIEAIPFENFKGIDSDSAPVRLRACFDTALAPEDIAARYRPYANPVPLNAPGWFDCFDAAALGAALEAGEARAYMGTENIAYGIDRVIAILPDGRGLVWHQINRCGEVVFDGNPAPADCPPAPES